MAFDYDLAKFIPFRDKEACQRVRAIKREDLTSVLTRETPALLGESESVDEDVAFVADSVVLLRYVEIDSAVQKALLVLKLRGSDHAKDIRRFSIRGDGIIVQDKFVGREGLLSGSPRSMTEAFRRAFPGPVSQQ